jgi:hypothetical protein
MVLKAEKSNVKVPRDIVLHLPMGKGRKARTCAYLQERMRAELILLRNPLSVSLTQSPVPTLIHAGDTTLRTRSPLQGTISQHSCSGLKFLPHEFWGTHLNHSARLNYLGCSAELPTSQVETRERATCSHCTWAGGWGGGADYANPGNLSIPWGTPVQPKLCLLSAKEAARSSEFGGSGNLPGGGQGTGRKQGRGLVYGGRSG